MNKIPERGDWIFHIDISVPVKIIAVNREKKFLTGLLVADFDTDKNTVYIDQVDIPLTGLQSIIRIPETIRLLNQELSGEIVFKEGMRIFMI